MLQFVAYQNVPKTLQSIPTKFRFRHNYKSDRSALRGNHRSLLQTFHNVENLLYSEKTLDPEKYLLQFSEGKNVLNFVETTTPKNLLSGPWGYSRSN